MERLIRRTVSDRLSYLLGCPHSYMVGQFGRKQPHRMLNAEQAGESAAESHTPVAVRQHRETAVIVFLNHRSVPSTVIHACQHM